ncbi:hypothetical protein RB195_007978 [Necator americanus]|uniref:Uncharacterized protein n=1 Tax=Necator americanus TaxID=51031 RepID=A0ABR1C3J1_NECAM
MVKKDLRAVDVNRQFRRDARLCGVWNTDEWIDSVLPHAEDEEGWAELCSRTTHLDEDAGNPPGDNMSSLAEMSNANRNNQ